MQSVHGLRGHADLSQLPIASVTANPLYRDATNTLKRCLVDFRATTPDSNGQKERKKTTEVKKVTNFFLTHNSVLVFLLLLIVEINSSW